MADEEQVPDNDNQQDTSESKDENVENVENPNNGDNANDGEQQNEENLTNEGDTQNVEAAGPEQEPVDEQPAANQDEPNSEEAPDAEKSAETEQEAKPVGEGEEGEAKAEEDQPKGGEEETEGNQETQEPVESTENPEEVKAEEADGDDSKKPEGEGESGGDGGGESGGDGEAKGEDEGQPGETADPNASGENAEPVPEDAAKEEDAEKEAGEGDDKEPTADDEVDKQEEKTEGAMDEIPQSDTFADGEKPESPAPHIGEVLSRQGSHPEEEIRFTPPVAESPRDNKEDEVFDVHELEKDMLSPEQDREALVEMYHQAITEREQLQQQNFQLQHKLAEYFKKKKSEEQKTESVDKNEADQEQRYLKYMSQLEELREEDQLIRETYSREIEELKRKCEEKQQEVEIHRGKFMEFKHQVALNSLNSRSGKPIPAKDIDQYLAAENRKDQEVIAVRLENIKLKNKVKKKEQQLKSKEELADGLHLIDFEQLKIENQTYNEKIEERNEELLKLRKKITNTVQVLTHLKEKLQFVQGENALLKTKLKEVESSVAQKRDVLTRTKQARDALRIDNHRLRQNCGLLGNEPLLRDFEERKDEADSLRDRLERLKMQHAELTLNTTSVRRKIEQIKATENHP